MPQVDALTFQRYRTNPALAYGFVERCRELDHLLLFPPGRDRGAP